MTTLQDRLDKRAQEIIDAERAGLERALRKANGYMAAAAKETGMTKARLRYRITRVHPDLGQLAKQLRADAGGARGRPRKARTGTRSRRRVLAAYRNHDTITAAAEHLDLPTTTMRDLLVEYGAIEAEP